MNDKLEYNKRSIGRRVYVVRETGFYAVVTEVKDELSFVVRDDLGKIHEVSVFDVRYV